MKKLLPGMRLVDPTSAPCYDYCNIYLLVAPYFNLHYNKRMWVVVCETGGEGGIGLNPFVAESYLLERCEELK